MALKNKTKLVYVLPQYFWKKLIEQDDRNIIFKISELPPLIQHVHDMKLFYTFLGVLHRMGCIDHGDRAKYIEEALDVTSKTTTTTEAVAIFKIILKHAKANNLIQEVTYHILDREAEIVNTSHAPFVQDIRNHLRRLDMRMDNTEARLDNVERRVDMMLQSLTDVVYYMRRKDNIQSATKGMCAILNALSLGVGGTILDAKFCSIGTCLIFRIW
jgi:hypothetical protein